MSNPIVDPLVVEPDTADSELLRIEATHDGAVTLTLKRPARRNALNAALIAALTDAFETLRGAEHVRVVFLAGEGAVFCAGGDLEWMRAGLDMSESDNRDDALTLGRMLQALYELPQLTVTLLHGAAYGGGAGLACACDVAIATADTKLCFSEVRLGLIPATISPYVVEAIGARAARRLFATAEVFDAETAHRLGLVTEVVPDAAALGAAAQRIATAQRENAPSAVAEAKAEVSAVAGRRIDHHLVEETSRKIARARVSVDGQEGVRAFLERRKPSWAL
ncbi:enoyl-CoA hydratase-related protein [Phenylobacterium immobile]|uniref:enoyl-CoA hydratase-related protein n=1 Tax=Phenylobacterium immobile TaxID=21 RepID=UPI000A47250A|nr:enoyl-CoA hydratase-related protein [Phenylobacterium immobile]